MTDITSTPPHKPTGRRRGTEYWVYFTLIFVLSLPSASIRWVRDIAKQQTLNLRGPLARAWAEADRLTPIIFSV